MPGGGGSTGKVRTSVLPGFGKAVAQSDGEEGALIQSPKGQWDTRAPRGCSGACGVFGRPFGLGQGLLGTLAEL